MAVNRNQIAIYKKGSAQSSKVETQLRVIMTTDSVLLFKDNILSLEELWST